MKAKKPVPLAYPLEMKTIGDHIRKRRLDLNLFQGQVAEILECEEDSVCYWENNRTQPSLKFIPGIIQFLGYNPFEDISSDSLGDRIIAYRRHRGISQENFARELGIDPTTLGRWEKDKSTTLKDKVDVLNALLQPEVSGEP